MFFSFTFRSFKISLGCFNSLRTFLPFGLPPVYSVALLKKKCSLKWEGKFYITSMFFDLNYKQGYHFVSIFEGCAQFAIEIF